MLVLSRERKQKILIGDDIIIEVVDIRGSLVRLGITAPAMQVDREEVRVLRTHKPVATDKTTAK